MANKKNIRICKYNHCKHQSKEIDITSDEYVCKNQQYFHKDCYKAKINGEWKDEQTKADIQLIKNLWIENISQTVVYSQLYQILNEFIERGISSNYLVFVMQYVIEHKMNLNYPAGFRYYVDKQEIKDAYSRKIAKKINNQKFVAVENEDDSPKFSIKIQKSGFQSILKNNGDT